jgi:ABC-2 type transport system permease protein
MLGSVFAKTVRDRWLGWLIAVLSMGFFVYISMAAYRSVDRSFYTGLPQAYRALLNIPPHADVGSLSIRVLVATYGTLTLGALAISMGGAAIAGEERSGTIGLLLANPKSRVHVLLSKAAAMIVLTALGAAGIYASVLLSARVLSVSIEGMHPAALMLHLFASALFYGFLAMAIGTATGNRGAAAGTSATIMVLGYLAVGLLPLFRWGKNLVKIFPWYYFSGSDPLLHGVQWWHIALLVGVSVALAVVAAVGVNRRDLKSHSVAGTLLDRIRANPTANKYLGALLGSAQVSSIWTKTASDYRGLLIICAYYAFLVQLALGPLYAAIPKGAINAIAQLPSGLVALVGGGNIATPAGFYQIETFGLMAPILVMIVTVAIGAGSVAGEESKRTMGLLLANPISRSRVLAEKAWAMTLYAFALGLITFAGVALGSKLGGLGISTWNIAITCLLATVLGLAFGALGMAVSAGTGSVSIGVYSAVGAAIFFHLVNSFAQLTDKLARFAKWSPFHYYLGNDPLNNGFDWANFALLVGVCIAFVAISFPLFARRDIRQRG